MVNPKLEGCISRNNIAGVGVEPAISGVEIIRTETLLWKDRLEKARRYKLSPEIILGCNNAYERHKQAYELMTGGKL